MGTIEVDEQKLDKLEAKLDSIVERLEQLVRLEVKHDNTDYRVTQIEKRLDAVNDKVELLQDNVTANSMITGGVERFGWILVTAVVGILAFFARGFGG